MARRVLLCTVTLAELRGASRTMRTWVRVARASGLVAEDETPEYVWPIGRPVVEVWVERDHG